MALSLQWAALDDLLLHLARRLADLTGLLSLITRPQRSCGGLRALRLVPSGERLLVLLVDDSAGASNLNLRLPTAASAELAALERWASGQLEQGAIDWSNLPPQLRLSGAVLRQGLDSHAQARRAVQADRAMAMGLGACSASRNSSAATVCAHCCSWWSRNRRRCCAATRPRTRRWAESGSARSTPIRPCTTARWCRPATAAAMAAKGR